LAHHKKTFEIMETPQNRRFHGRMECLPLWPTYIGEKRRTLTYEIKMRCYGEHLWGTHWEPNGNSLGIWREHVGNKRKMKKIPPPYQATY